MTREIYPESGRPPMFNDPMELQKLISDYFNNAPTKEREINGQIIDVPYITVTGLCLHCGFASRQSFYDYGKKDLFSYTIERARLWIENEYELKLHDSHCTGAIFALKNMGWHDKHVSEIELSADIKERRITSEMSAEDATELYKSMIK